MTATNAFSHRILILDFGSQYAQLVARRVRELGVYCELHPWDIRPEVITQFLPKGIILTGGPNTVTQPESPRIPQAVFDLGCPVLGICYGMQAMALQLGGKVKACNQAGEFGYAKLQTNTHHDLFEGINDGFNNEGLPVLDVWMSHGDQVTELPPAFSCSAQTHQTPIAAMSNDEQKLYGMQFHPEVTHTIQGKKLLDRFLREICQCNVTWQAPRIIEERIKAIRQQVGQEKVLLGLSGGVDSSVTAALLHHAIGDQLICVFVDNGLLRLNEASEVMTAIAQNRRIQVIPINAANRFFKALSGVTDPEQKRKIIGREFIQVFEAVAKQQVDIKWLAQGTIYPDVIESAGGHQSGTAKVIKSHHNVGGLPNRLALKLLEPLRTLFKDEVRQLGTELGLPTNLINRHPFPGPGLGVRILGEVKQPYVEQLRQVDAIFINALNAEGLYDKVSQAFAVFLPICSVGVLGDGRQYGHVVALRAVETVDFMTAQWADLPHAFLDKVSRQIMNEVKGITRVTYDISSKPPATIEWE